MNRCIVAGSRNFSNYGFMKHILDYWSERAIKDNIEIVCGMAPGADMLGHRWAEENGITVVPFPAKWGEIEGKPVSEIGTRRDGSKYWKGAGFARNVEMAKYAAEGKGFCFLFWDGESGGTANMAANALKYDLETILFSY